jgi:hypothetical protein
MWPVGSHVKLLAHAGAISPKAACEAVNAFDQVTGARSAP